MSDEDWQIVEKVLAGDIEAFEWIIKKHKSQVFKIVSAMVDSQEVEEVAHQAFIRAFRDLATYRRKAPFAHWMSKVTVRTCYDYWRRVRSNRVQIASEEKMKFFEAASSNLLRCEMGAVERAHDLVDWALSHLKPQDRLAFTLIYLEDMSLKEVSATLGWSVIQLKMRSFRARNALRKLLKERMEGS